MVLEMSHAQEAFGLNLGRILREETGAALLLVSHDPAILGSFSRSESLADLNHASQIRTAPAP